MRIILLKLFDIGNEHKADIKVEDENDNADENNNEDESDNEDENNDEDNFVENFCFSFFFHKSVIHTVNDGETSE